MSPSALTEEGQPQIRNFRGRLNISPLVLVQTTQDDPLIIAPGTNAFRVTNRSAATVISLSLRTLRRREGEGFTLQIVQPNYRRNTARRKPSSPWGR